MSGVQDESFGINSDAYHVPKNVILDWMNTDFDVSRKCLNHLYFLTNFSIFYSFAFPKLSNVQQEPCIVKSLISFTQELLISVRSTGKLSLITNIWITTKS